MPSDYPYSKTTRSIRVSVAPSYLPEQSAPALGRYIWRYEVRIENRGNDTVQLLNRYWRITDAMGRVKEVRGPGVVGQQPMLPPGAVHEYESGTPLSTPSGIMEGNYEMRSESGETFEAAIPAFSLDSPHQRIN